MSRTTLPSRISLTAFHRENYWQSPPSDARNIFAKVVLRLIMVLLRQSQQMFGVLCISLCSGLRTIHKNQFFWAICLCNGFRSTKFVAKWTAWVPFPRTFRISWGQLSQNSRKRCFAPTHSTSNKPTVLFRSHYSSLSSESSAPAAATGVTWPSSTTNAVKVERRCSSTFYASSDETADESIFLSR